MYWKEKDLFWKTWYSWVEGRRSPDDVSAHSTDLSTFRKTARMLASRPDESTYSPHLLQGDLFKISSCNSHTHKEFIVSLNGNSSCPLLPTYAAFEGNQVWAQCWWVLNINKLCSHTSQDTTSRQGSTNDRASIQSESTCATTKQTHLQAAAHAVLTHSSSHMWLNGIKCTRNVLIQACLTLLPPCSICFFQHQPFTFRRLMCL